MANAAIAYLNLADRGSVSASSQELLMASSMLLQPDVEQRWRSKSGEAFIVAAPAAGLFDTVVLRGLTVGAAAVVRVRISSADTSGSAGDVKDTGWLPSGSAEFDSTYGALCYLHPSQVAGIVRIDINDPGTGYVEAGRLFIGARTEFKYNFAYGWQVQWVDRSVRQESRGGQTLVWRDNHYRTLDLNLEWVTQEQRYGIVETVDRVNGLHTDVLIITDTISVNLARDSIFGLVSDLTPVIQANPVFDEGGSLFSKSYKIKERL